MHLLFLLFNLWVVAVSGCLSDADCGSADNTQPGLCQAGVCQCGIGYSGNRAVDPISCGLVCTPSAVPDSIAFLREPNVTVTAASGNLLLDVRMEPYLRQTPATVAFLNPSNGTACALMAAQLGTGAWLQEVADASGACVTHYLYSAPFAATVGGACWQGLGSSVETGAQQAITYKQYETQVEVVQQGLAPFGQTATRQAGETTIARAFRRNYKISVATTFQPSTAPFELIAAPPVPPSLVNDSAATRENVAVAIAVLDNDVRGYQMLDGVQVPVALNVSRVTIEAAPQHGAAVVLASGIVTYTPENLYYGADSFVYQACDTANNCGTAHVSVTVQPDGPTAVADAARVNYTQSVDIDVLSNDLAGVGGLVTVTIATGPNNGTAAVIAGTRHIVYTAATGFAGVATLTYEVCDVSKPVPLCSRARVVIDVGGLGPLGVADVATVGQNGAAIRVPVLSNDLPGTSPLNPANVTIVGAPSSGTATVSASGEIVYSPATGFHGDATLTYRVCDLAGLCSAPTTVTVTVTASYPTARDDAAQTAYSTSVTVVVLANDAAGAQPLSSVTVVTGPATGTATVNADKSVTYTPPAGFVGTATLVYEACDNSTPTALCARATVTVVVTPLTGGGIRYRLVKIDYDVLRGQMVATVQTETPRAAKVSGVALGLSTGIAPVVAGPTTGAACDASSPAGVCHQFHTVAFAASPCAVANAELVLTAGFVCANGAAATTCGYQGTRDVYRMGGLFLTYDSCPRVVQYGIDGARSYLRLNTDAARTAAVTAPATQGETLFGRCSIAPSAGSAFQSVSLTAMHVMRQDQSGPTDLGDRLQTPLMTLISQATQNSPTLGEWDFDLAMDPAVFQLAKTYYLEATVTLIFSNTGVLTRSLRIPLTGARVRGSTLLRSNLSRSGEVVLVALEGRQSGSSPQTQAVGSNTFLLRAAVSSSITTSSSISTIGAEATSSAAAAPASTATIAAVAAAVGVAVVAAAALIAVVVARRRRRERALSATDAPLQSAALSSTSNDLDF